MPTVSPSRRAVLMALGALACVPSVRAADQPLKGAGASFPARVYAQWAAAYTQEQGVAIGYQSTGSSDGIAQIKARAVDFGATDVPLPEAELDKHGLFQFPTLVGGVVPVVNLPGIAPGSLRLDAEVLAAIFAGRIQRWNDPAIAAPNPGVALPNLRITRVVRADGSGTTEVFLRYLQLAAPSVAKAIALSGGKAQWPGEGIEAVAGSSKVAAAVLATRGAIGYISSDYMVRDKLAPVALRNKRGEWVAPELKGYRAALKAATAAHDSFDVAALLDADASMAWPIVTATYIIVDRAPASAERAGRTLNFFYRSFLQGDKAVAGSGFAPLPVDMQARIVARLASFRTTDGRALPVLDLPGAAH